jgi:hypothetical protein
VVSDTVIDGNNIGPVVTFESGEGPNCILSGFVLTGGQGTEAGAIYCHGSSPTVCNCLIVGNRAVSGSGGAVACWQSGCILHHCTISGNYAAAPGVAIFCSNSNITVRDSIIWGNGPDEIYAGSGSAPELNYCTVLGAWSGVSNYDIDPCFASPGYWADTNDPNLPADPNDPDTVWIAGDYHLQSQSGRWDPSVQEWVFDDVTSPAVDAGDPNSVWTQELWPHGRRVNVGAFGGTSEASMSPSDTSNVADLNHDDVVDYRDLALITDRWPVEQVLLRADLDRNGLVAFGDIALMGQSWLTDTALPSVGPAAPANLIATPGDGQISLDWDDNTEGNLAGYNVYRSLKPGLGYSRISQSLQTNSEYVDANVTNCITYYYVVTAQDTSGYESAYSPELSASPGPQPVMKLLAYDGVTTIGADVSKWEDQAKSNHAQQQVVAYRPELILSAINGEPAVEFDGTGEHLDVASSADINTGGPYLAKTLVVVFKTGSDIASRQLIWEQGGDTRGLNIYLDSGNLYINGWNLGEMPWLPTAVNAPIFADTGYIAILEMDTSTGMFRGFINAIGIGSVGGITLLHDHSGACALGRVEGRTKFHDGSTGGPASFAGRIAEFHQYNTVLSGSDRQRLEEALMEKYAIRDGLRPRR